MRLHFLGCGTKGLIHSNGNNSALIITQNQGNNMLLMDCGGNTDKAIERTNILGDIDNVVAFFSHTHPDHMNKVVYLLEECRRRKINFRFLLPTDRSAGSPYEELMEELTDNYKIRARDLKELWPHRVAAMMNLDGITMETIKHGAGNSTALILKQRPFGDKVRTDTVYATDHNDEEFIERMIRSERTLEHLYTDSTDCAGSQEHMTFNKLRELIPLRLRSRVTLMHMNSNQLSFRAQWEGFNTADDLLIRCEGIKDDTDETAEGKKNGNDNGNGRQQCHRRHPRQCSIMPRGR